MKNEKLQKLMRRDYMREYRRKNGEKLRDCAREYSRKYRQKNKEKINQYSIEYMRERRNKIRKEIFSLLGSNCARCGFSDLRALQIDHVDGGGYKERSSCNNIDKYYLNILKKVKSGSKDYQILCANCNWIKKHDFLGEKVG